MSSSCELAFRERAFVNEGLRVDHFTALSIAAHSCLSSLERAHLLITMGLILSQIRDSKFVSLELCGDFCASAVHRRPGGHLDGLQIEASAVALAKQDHLQQGAHF